nr:hypothetical protein [uncultured Pseudomonas sp.]
MAWAIPVFLFAASFVLWRMSFRADDSVVAWCRFLLAGFPLILALIYVAALAIHSFSWLA